MKARRLVTHHAADRTWSLGPRLFEPTPHAPLFAHRLAVLRAYGTAPGSLTPRELGMNAELPQSVVRRIMPLMEEADLLWAEPDGSYRLGLELFSLAARVGWVNRISLEGTALGAALKDPTEVHIMDGAVEEGVIAVACGIEGSTACAAMLTLQEPWARRNGDSR